MASTLVGYRRTRSRRPSAPALDAAVPSADTVWSRRLDAGSSEHRRTRLMTELFPTQIDGIGYSVCAAREVPEMAGLIAEVFSRDDPPPVAVGLTPDEFEAFVRLISGSTASDGLTIIAHDIVTGEMAGALLAEDATTTLSRGRRRSVREVRSNLRSLRPARRRDRRCVDVRRRRGTASVSSRGGSVFRPTSHRPAPRHGMPGEQGWTRLSDGGGRSNERRVTAHLRQARIR